MSTRNDETAAPSWDECMGLLESWPSLALAARLQALERLARNPSPGIRERTLRMGAATFSDEQLVAFLREAADATLRNAGLEILKLRGGKSFQVALQLLKDPDEDVVLQAVLVLDHLRDPRALEPIRAMLSHPDPNVVQAAILTLGRIGNARTIPDLLPFLHGDSWLQLAAVQALGDLRATAAVRPLAALLTDLFAGPLATEAIARIGGQMAFRALAAHWIFYGDQLDVEVHVGLLAHVLEGLSQTPPHFAELALSLAARLGDVSLEVSSAAARCLLALGETAWDGAALDLLALTALGGERGAVPAALAHRHDLIGTLLAGPGEQSAWGIQLAAQHPQHVPPAAFFAALSRGVAPDLLPAVARVFLRLRYSDTATTLLDLYLDLPIDLRGALEPAIVQHKEAIRGLLAQRRSIGAVDALVLAARLGQAPREVAKQILALSPSERPTALAQLAELRAAVRLLPWESWVEESPEIYADLAADVACRAGLRELVPVLRERARAAPTPALLRALGELRDRDSVAVLTAVAERHPDLAPLALESLGRIGGPDARAALAGATRAPDAGRARIAYRALSLCATADDRPLFHAAVAHPDWYVRLASAEVLGRLGRPEDLPSLALLASDPVSAVAHRALTALEG